MKRVLHAVFAFLSTAAYANAQQYSISTIVGGAPIPTPTLAGGVSIGFIVSLAAASTGEVYFHVPSGVYKISDQGILLHIAGNFKTGFTGDGGPASQASLQGPSGLALDGAG